MTTVEGGEGSPHLDMPPIDDEWRAYIEMLFDAGPAASTGMGETAISWSEMAAWCALTGNRLSAIEAGMIRRLSSVYAAARHEMTEHDAPAPWPEPDANDRDEKDRQVQHAIGAMFAAMSKKGNRE
jgi:hypothetical protein